MFKWIKSFFSHSSKPSGCLYKCTYSLNAHLSQGVAAFKLDSLQEAYAHASTQIEAQSTFAKKLCMSPHVYIHKIEKVLEVTCM